MRRSRRPRRCEASWCPSGEVTFTRNNLVLPTKTMREAIGRGSAGRSASHCLRSLTRCAVVAAAYHAAVALRSHGARVHLNFGPYFERLPYPGKAWLCRPRPSLVLVPAPSASLQLAHVAFPPAGYAPLIPLAPPLAPHLLRPNGGYAARTPRAALP
jgi:hypothetical protein